MRPVSLMLGLLAIGLVTFTAPVMAQQNPHIGHVMTSFMNTPDSQGLLPVAIAEAEVAAQHAGLAGRDPANLDAMKLHAGHVLHALDPSLEANGPGPGYGLKRAATGVSQHINLAAGTEGASANIKTHAQHVSTSAMNVVARADAMIALIERIRAADSAATAAPLVAELTTLAGQLVAGVDANGDGTVGWQEGEGGLQQAQQHMELMIRGEGGRW